MSVHSFEKFTVIEPPTSGEVFERILTDLNPNVTEYTTVTLHPERDIPEPIDFDATVAINGINMAKKRSLDAKDHQINFATGEVMSRSDIEFDIYKAAAYGSHFIRIEMDAEDPAQPAIALMLPTALH